MRTKIIIINASHDDQAKETRKEDFCKIDVLKDANVSKREGKRQAKENENE